MNTYTKSLKIAVKNINIGCHTKIDITQSILGQKHPDFDTKLMENVSTLSMLKIRKKYGRNESTEEIRREGAKYRIIRKIWKIWSV